MIETPKANDTNQRMLFLHVVDGGTEDLSLGFIFAALQCSPVSSDL